MDVKLLNYLKYLQFRDRAKAQLHYSSNTRVIWLKTGNLLSIFCCNIVRVLKIRANSKQTSKIDYSIYSPIDRCTDRPVFSCHSYRNAWENLYLPQLFSLQLRYLECRKMIHSHSLCFFMDYEKNVALYIMYIIVCSIAFLQNSLQMTTCTVHVRVYVYVYVYVRQRSTSNQIYTKQ